MRSQACKRKGRIKSRTRAQPGGCVCGGSEAGQTYSYSAREKDINDRVGQDIGVKNITGGRVRQRSKDAPEIKGKTIKRRRQRASSPSL